MFTLTAENGAELIPLLEWVARETFANAFSFDLGRGQAAAGLSAGRVRALFEDYRRV